MTKHKLKDSTPVHKQLFEWWRREGRVLPWREKGFPQRPISLGSQRDRTQLAVREHAFSEYFASSLKRDPYRVVVSELMLQQTQVDRVLPKFRAWMERWPTVKDLAKATLPEVLIFWQGLGYNRRARFLWLLAQEIAHHRNGVWPTTEVELLKLPGVGKYTARALLSFAFGVQVGVVDTNVKRIINRVFMGEESPLMSEKEYFELADQILPKGQADPWNQAIMDFGALVCVARTPRCEKCPLRMLCKANLHAQTKGFLSYAEYLKHAASLGETKTRKTLPLKFEDTDRYFRGRIMDELRSASYPFEQLQKLLRKNYGLLEPKRFERLIDSLKKDRLINEKKGLIFLGE